MGAVGTTNNTLNTQKTGGTAMIQQTTENKKNKTVKFAKEWFFGGSKKDNSIDDYVDRYVASNGAIIECKYGFTSFSNRWYEVDGKHFDTLAEAKAYVIANAK